MSSRDSWKQVKWGTPVVSTDTAIKKGVFKDIWRGVFLGLSQDKTRIRVVQKNRSTVYTYHPSYWRIDPWQ